MLLKRQVFERIGLFCEEFFLSYDDMELCWRARLAGFHVGLAERSVCHHAYNFQARLEWLYFFQRNRLLTLLTLERLGTILLIIPCLAVSELVVGLYFIAQGRAQTVWALLRYFLRWETWTAIAARRRILGRLRVRKDAEIVKPFAGPVMFTAVDSLAMRCLVNPVLQLYWNAVKWLIVW